MLGRQSRLSRNELKEVQKTGRLIHNRLFSLKIVRPKEGHAKFAFVASGKELGGSVDRNRAKRRARAATKEIKLTSPTHCVIYIKRAFTHASFRDIVKELSASIAGFR